MGNSPPVRLEQLAELDFDRPVHTLFGLPFDAMELEAAVEHVLRCVRERRRCFISTPNVNFVIAAQDDAAFRASVLRSDLSLIDGMPLVWVARLLRLPIRQRVAGSDLFARLRRHKGEPLKVYFFGGAAGVGERAGAVLNAEAGGLRCVGHACPGFGSVEDMSRKPLIDHINASGADFVVVSLGAKKGQAWIERNREQLAAPIVSHLGAVVNFVAGEVLRAPPWLQGIGLEWLWRIKAEPALWRRYAGDGWVFARLFLTRVIPYAWSIRHARAKVQVQGSAAVEHDQSAAAHVLVLRGAWDASNVGALRQAFARAAAGMRPVQIDLGQVTCLDTSVIALLSLLWTHCLHGGYGWSLGELQPRVRVALRRCCADYLIPPVEPVRFGAAPGAPPC